MGSLLLDTFSNQLLKDQKKLFTFSPFISTSFTVSSINLCNSAGVGTGYTLVVRVSCYVPQEENSGRFFFKTNSKHIELTCKTDSSQHHSSCEQPQDFHRLHME
jgi:hypothetical protein